MINITHTLSSELKVDLAAGEEAYIHFRGYISSCMLSLILQEAGATAIIQSTLASKAALEEFAAVKDDFLWENIRVDGVEYPEVSFEIPSTAFNAPIILYIKNTSGSDQAITVFLRGKQA